MRRANLYGVVALSLLGLADTLWVTREELALGRAPRCVILKGCDQVLSSAYAHVGPVPTAAFGVAFFALVLSLATTSLLTGHWDRAVLWLAAPATAIVLLLVGLQAFAIRHWCVYCLFSAAMTAGIFALSLLGRANGAKSCPA